MNYNLTELPVLGQGRFGTVYKLDEKTALKVINVGPNKDLKKMALEEVEWLMRLNRSALAASYSVLGPGQNRHNRHKLSFQIR